MFARKAPAPQPSEAEPAARKPGAAVPFNHTHYRLVTSVHGAAPPAVLQRKCATCDDDEAAAQRKVAGAGGTLRQGPLSGIRVGPADDALEREADRAADVVMRSPQPSPPEVPAAEAPPAAPAPCATCEGEVGKTAQRRAAPESGAESAAAAPSTEGPAPGARSVGVSALEGRGQPLPAPARALFESRFHSSFASVRVHDDAAASQMAADVSARAFTLGPHIVFGRGEYRPHEPAGQRLLAHELAHVVQQGAASRARGDLGASLTTAAGGPYLARTPLDVTAIRAGIEASVAPVVGTPPAAPAAQSGEVSGAFAAQPSTQPVPRRRRTPPPDPAPVPVDTTLPLQAHFFPAPRTTHRRALVLGGFHGDEEPGYQLSEETITQLGTPGSPLARDLFFHTIVIPRVNPGGVHDHLAGVTSYDRRCNRQRVDLNRNFPTSGSASSRRCVNTAAAPTQPETQGVMDVIQQFRPDRILSMHAIRDRESAGIFADPNTDPAAIDLACTMASQIADPPNREGNQLTATSCNPIYRDDTRGHTVAGTLGEWAPGNVPGATSPVPTITLEAPTYVPLSASGVRSIPSFMQGVSRFLTNPEQEDQEILRDIRAFSAADRVLFLTGRLSVANAIYQRIRTRIEQRVAALNGLGPPREITIVSQQRAFDVSAGGSSPQAEIVFEKFFMTGSCHDGWDTLDSQYYRDGRRSRGVDRATWLALPTVDRFTEILRFSSLPGTSRHHWGTDVDFNSTINADWEPATSGRRRGRFHRLGLWLTANAPSMGFLQAYTARPPSGTAGRTGGYDPEAWHYSYAPIATPLRTMYNADVHLTTDVVDAIVADFTTRAGTAHTIPADLRSGLLSLNIGSFVNDVGPGL